MSHQSDELSGVLRQLAVGALFRLAALLAAMQAEEDGQRPALVEELNLNGQYHPDVAPVKEWPATRREQRVAMHRRTRDALARVAPESVIDHETQDALWAQALDDQACQRQADLIRRPACTREKSMVAADMLSTDGTRGSNDFGHGMPPQVQNPTGHQGREAGHRWRGEAFREGLKQRDERGYDGSVQDEQVR